MHWSEAEFLGDQSIERSTVSHWAWHLQPGGTILKFLVFYFSPYHNSHLTVSKRLRVTCFKAYFQTERYRRQRRFCNSPTTKCRHTAKSHQLSFLAAIFGTQDLLMYQVEWHGLPGQIAGWMWRTTQDPWKAFGGHRPFLLSVARYPSIKNICSSDAGVVHHHIVYLSIGIGEGHPKGCDWCGDDCSNLSTSWGPKLIIPMSCCGQNKTHPSTALWHYESLLLVGEAAKKRKAEGGGTGKAKSKAKAKAKTKAAAAPVPVKTEEGEAEGEWHDDGEWGHDSEWDED